MSRQTDAQTLTHEQADRRYAYIHTYRRMDGTHLRGLRGCMWSRGEAYENEMAAVMISLTRDEERIGEEEIGE